jgi:hypothetical protein
MHCFLWFDWCFSLRLYFSTPHFWPCFCDLPKVCERMSCKKTQNIVYICRYIPKVRRYFAKFSSFDTLLFIRWHQWPRKYFCSCLTSVEIHFIGLFFLTRKRGWVIWYKMGSICKMYKLADSLQHNLPQRLFKGYCSSSFFWVAHTLGYIQLGNYGHYS